MQSDEAHTALLKAFAGWDISHDMTAYLAEKGLVDAIDIENFLVQKSKAEQFKPVITGLTSIRQDSVQIIGLESYLLNEHCICEEGYDTFADAMAGFHATFRQGIGMGVLAKLIEAQVWDGFYRRFIGLSNGNRAEMEYYTIDKNSWEKETLESLCSGICPEKMRSAGARLSKMLEDHSKGAYDAARRYDKLAALKKNLELAHLAGDVWQLAERMQFISDGCEEWYISHLDNTMKRITLGFYKRDGTHATRLSSEGYCLATILIRNPTLVQQYPDFEKLNTKFNEFISHTYFPALKAYKLSQSLNRQQ